MKKLFKIAIIIIILGAGSFYYNDVLNSINDYYLEKASPKNNIASEEEAVPEIETEKVADKEEVKPVAKETPKVEEIVSEPEVNISTPLKAPYTDTESDLTAYGVVIATNVQRMQNGLMPLEINDKLTLSAQNKVNDMFARQYFEHESPTGEGPDDLAKAVGYEYLMVGENLALGNFEDDEALVEAWMNSPGHRANILNSKYTEIGVAVKFGKYEDYYTWLAVQEFGRPASDCPQPNPTLASQIEKEKILAEQLKDEIVILYDEITNMTPKRGSLYNEKVEIYNTIVAQYNELVEKIKISIIEYNLQVSVYNACL